MTVMVDTSVWSLALRRDRGDDGVAQRFAALLAGAEDICVTGLILQELLQGFGGPKQTGKILETFASIPLVVPAREDHVHAAELRNRCRRKGVQVGTIDALIAQLCIRYTLSLLTADQDFGPIARFSRLTLFDPPESG